MLIKYDLAVLIETSKFLDDFETTIVKLYLENDKISNLGDFIYFISSVVPCFSRALEQITFNFNPKQVN